MGLLYMNLYVFNRICHQAYSDDVLEVFIEIDVLDLSAKLIILFIIYVYYDLFF